ncbi:MAG: hypothetical protein PIR53_17820 [Nocardioides alkalitolerans]
MSLACGFVVDFSDPDPASTYELSVSPADVGSTASSVVLDPATGTGVGRMGCTDAGGGALVPGTDYTLTLEKRDGSGRVVEAVSRVAAYDRVPAPKGVVVRVGGIPTQGELRDDKPISIEYSGSWASGTTFSTLVMSVSAGADPLDPGLDPLDVDRHSYSWNTNRPISSFPLTHVRDGSDVYMSIRAERPGQDAAVLVFPLGRAVVIPPPPIPIPSHFISWPGTRVQYRPLVGQPSGVTPPILSQSAINVGITPTYQWLSGRTPIPGATGPFYTPTASDVGRGLILEITFAAPGYVAKSGGFIFAEVRRRPVPGGWLTRAPVKSGQARAGTVVSVDGPRLSHTAVVSGARVHYQWFLDGREIPGATSPSYKVAHAARGGHLTVGVAVVKQDWEPRTGTLSFGLVR